MKYFILCSILVLVTNHIRAIDFENEDLFTSHTRGHGLMAPDGVATVRANDFAGIEIQWIKAAQNESRAASSVDARFSALKDFDLHTQLPTNGEALSRLVQSRVGAMNLPVLLNDNPYFATYNFHGHNLFLSSLKETSQGLMAELVFSVVTPEDQVLHFKGIDIPILGMGTELCGLTMVMENDTETNDPEFPITIKGSMNLDDASYVTFSCDGFENFQLLCEYRFPNALLKPLTDGHNHVRAMFKITSTELGSFIGSVAIDPFEINGVDDVQFEIVDAVVDYSTGENHEGMLEIINPAWPADLKNKYTHETWRGFFMKALTVRLPEGLAHTSGERITIAINDLLADHGSGITGKASVHPNVNGNISGWGFSVEELILEVLANSLHEFKLTGGINIPVMDGTSQYQALFNYPPGDHNKAEISFNLTLDGTYQMPFIGNSKLVLNNGSTAGISYFQNKFQPHAVLHGQLDVSLNTPSVSLPSLEFENFKINDFSLPSFGDVAGKVTGGLDKISIGAFGFGGIKLPSGGSGYNRSKDKWLDLFQDQELYASGPNNAYIYEAYYDEEDNNPPQGNRKMNGFPITIKNIGLNKAMDGNVPCYKLEFGIDINFAKGVSAFKAEGGFGIWGALDFNKILTSEPWEALSYRKTTVESILIDADLGKISIKGGVAIITDDPIYGSGFKGAIAMSVNLPTAGFIVQCVGQFGVAPGTNDFRYFFVDAEVGFNSGLALGSTGLSIFGFSGGFFYNMERQGLSPQDVAASKKISSMPPNNPPKLNGSLLQPGVSLSGTVYVPHQNKTSFKVGMIFGLAAPQTLLADVAFGMDIKTSDFAVQRIYFEGGAYLMNKGVSDRKNASAVLKLKLEFDVANAELIGSFGMAFNVPTGSPPSLSVISGNYNTSLSSVNLYFKFKGNKEYFFFAGTPNEPMKINFKLSDAIKLGNLNAYVMVGTNMPSIPSLAETFDKEGYDLPSNLREIAGRGFITGDRGVAFGARLKVPKQSYNFLMFRASFQAMAGFDASLMHVTDKVTCGTNGTFGMNNWYMQGQAYGAFKGAISMRVSLLFWSGTVKLAELEAGAALQARLPNPTWMMGFLYGRYSVLSGAVKGSFSFKVEMGKVCDDLPAYNPLAAIPLIQDVHPMDQGIIDVYAAPSATFFLPMDKEVNVPIIKDNGSTEIKIFKTYLNTSKTKLTQSGSSIPIPVSIIYKDNGSMAIFQPNGLLLPNTAYVFTISAGWKEIKGTQVIVNNVFEERKVKFKTGDKPQKMVAQAIGYHAPGLRQRYWHKNYARPMLEFKQHGWDYLFPKTRKVEFKIKDPALANAFTEDGWTKSNSGDSIKLSKTFDLKYVSRLKKLSDNSVVDIDIDEVPERTQKPTYVLEFQTIVFYGFTFQIPIGYKKVYVDNKIVRFDDLNAVNLEKEKIYGLEIIRKLADPVKLPVMVQQVENTESIMYSDTLEAYTAETIHREITSLGGALKTLNAQIGEDVLYKDYFFGVSKYNHIRYKVYDIVHTESKRTAAINTFDHPDPSIPNPKLSFPTQDVSYGFSNPIEPFDAFDQDYLRINFKLRTDGVYGNPVRDYMINQRKIIDLIGFIGDRAWKDTRYMRTELTKNTSKSQTIRNQLNVSERVVQSSIIPYDLYFPRNKDKKEFSGQSGIVIHPNNNLGHWYDFKSKKYNQDAHGTRLSYNTYKKFVQKVADNYLNTNGWANVFYFNTTFGNLLTNSEIQSKTMKKWGAGYYPANYTIPRIPNTVSGSTVMWIQNNEGRILRNQLQLYKFHGESLVHLYKALSIDKSMHYRYLLLRNYYTEGPSYLYFKLLGDMFTNNRLGLLKHKELGFRLKVNINNVPDYINSEALDNGNTRGVKVQDFESYDDLLYRVLIYFF